METTSHSGQDPRGLIVSAILLFALTGCGGGGGGGSTPPPAPDSATFAITLESVQAVDRIDDGNIQVTGGSVGGATATLR